MIRGATSDRAHPEHPTAPRGLVAVVVVGMVLISLGTVLGSFLLLLAGLAVFIGSFGWLIATTPEPTREVRGADGKLHPVPDPRAQGAAPRPGSVRTPSSALEAGHPL